MGNWEYKQVYCNVQEVLSTLNKLGGQGWELCASNGDMFYFKRSMKCVNCKNYNRIKTNKIGKMDKKSYPRQRVGT